ncbi:MAG: molybdate ABC transporter substrate-binding protein [Tepidisphaerales bacterium]
MVLYCAAGIQPPVHEIVAAYEKETGVAVQVQYGGSGQLLGNIEASRRGDLFIAADASYIEIGRKKGLVREAIPLATMRPVILVAAGNPKKIAGLNDLLRSDLRMAIANPDQASIGRTLRALLQKTGQWSAFEKHVAVFKPTVNDTANDVKVGSVDAAVVWDATARQYPALAMIRDPQLDTVQEQVTIGILSASAQPTEALRAARYLAARDRGLPIFKKHLYEPAEGDVWAPTPSILFYSGAVNRPAIDQTVTAFEQREGCRVSRVYNGCGILVAQMKAQQKPDAYLACDVSFVPPVADLFLPSTDVSETDIVLAVPKGNPKAIKTFADLTRSGLRVGIANAEQSTLGALTRTLLQKAGILDAVMANVRTQTPTADTLVSQAALGSLDAVVVYTANLSQARNRLDEIAIPSAKAVQPFSIGKASDHKQLVGRLLDAIRSDESRKRYESLGFRWRAEAGK